MARPKAQGSADSQSETASDNESPKTTKRFYTGTQELDSDLFKLVETNMVKNVSWGAKPDYQKMLHGHFMRTVDSSGKQLNTCSPVGGHFHFVEVSTDSEGNLVATCSPAMIWAKKRIEGDVQRVAIPIEFDSHTHETQYVKSHRVQKRETNERFAELQSKILAKIPGAVEGVR